MDKTLPASLREEVKLCFACGKDNPYGLKLEFKKEKDEVFAYFTPSPYHQGWPGILHGGIISTLLDEAIGYTTFFLGLKTVTAKIEIRFKKPVPLSKKLKVSARLLQLRKNFATACAKLEFLDGEVVAEAKALMFLKK